MARAVDEFTIAESNLRAVCPLQGLSRRDLRRGGLAIARALLESFRVFEPAEAE